QLIEPRALRIFYDYVNTIIDGHDFELNFSQSERYKTSRTYSEESQKSINLQLQKDARIIVEEFPNLALAFEQVKDQILKRYNIRNYAEKNIKASKKPELTGVSEAVSSQPATLLPASGSTPQTVEYNLESKAKNLSNSSEAVNQWKKI